MTIYRGTLGQGVYSEAGVDPTVLSPIAPATGVSNGGVPVPSMRVGTVITGAEGSSFTLCKYVLAATTDILPGQVFQWDRAYTASLITTALGVLNQEAGVSVCFANAVPAGSYYIWLQRTGHAPMRTLAASVATGAGETTTTAGTLKFLTTPTGSSYGLPAAGGYLASAGFTFTANTTNGSPTLTNVSSITDLALGASIAGTGIPANANIATIRSTGGSFVIDIGTTTTGALTTLQNCTANGTAITVTVTLTLPAALTQPLAVTRLN